MIFTGIKRKCNQLFFNKRIANLPSDPVEISSQKITKILVLLDEFADKLLIEENLYRLLNFSDENIEVLIFQSKIKKNKVSTDIFTPGDFGWFGKLKSHRLKKILTKKFDLLINYSKVDNIYINMLLLQCNAGFKVGFSHLDNRYYDLLINCESDNFELFNQEMKKYLQILKKL